jgi:rhodanese-related sulfurtransferase
MKFHKILLVVGLSLGAMAFVGCKKEAAPEASKDSKTETKTAAATPKEVTVDQLSTWLKGDKPPKIFDANNDSTRKQFGSIPGATLLSSTEFEPKKVLPASKDEKLVFYCSNTKCRAAEGAAGKAVVAGYTDVNVLRAGIRGWKEAGQPTSKLN